MSISERNKKLAQAFQFSSADLTINKQGGIAESQQATVEKFRKGRRISLVAFAVTAGLFFLGLIGVGISTLFNQGDNAIRYAIMGALGFVILALAGSSVNFYLRSRELLSGQVSLAEGAARPIETAAGEYGIAYFVKIGNKKLQLKSQAEHDAFDEGENYRLYFVKGYPLSVILSAEAY